MDSKGSGLVKLDVKSAAIPRWSVLANGDTVITYVTKAGDNSSDKTFKSASTWQVPFASGKFGKPVKLFDGSFHGGISEDESLARDYSKRTAFLDFGGETGKAFVHEKYRVHEYLLVADSSYKCRWRSHENCPCPLGG